MFFPYADDAPLERRFTWMTWLLIAVNTGLFIKLGTEPNYEATVFRWGFIPYEFTPVTLITCLFLHGSYLHLFGNMWFLFLFGDNVESRCGPFKYLVAYLLCGVAGDLGHYAFFPDSIVPTIGASGSIFGIMGMYMFFFPANRVKAVYWIFLFIGTLSVRAFWIIGLFAFMEFLYAQLQTTSGVETGVGHLAHGGGFVAGVFLAALYTALNLVRNDRHNLWAHILDGRPAPRAHAQDDNVIDAKYKILRDGHAPDDPRNEIVRLLHAGRVDDARRLWRRYAFDNHHGVLPVREQLEVALALDKNGERGIARDAYERLLANYADQQPYAAEANLALAGMLLQEMNETGDRHEVPLVERLLRDTLATHPQQSRRDIAARWLAALQS